VNKLDVIIYTTNKPKNVITIYIPWQLCRVDQVMRDSWSVGPREWKTAERFVCWYNFFFYFFIFFYFIILSSAWCNHWRFQDGKKARTFYFLKEKPVTKSAYNSTELCLHNFIAQHNFHIHQLTSSCTVTVLLLCLQARRSLSQRFWRIWRISIRIFSVTFM
jgi:hypothetical protein